MAQPNDVRPILHVSPKHRWQNWHESFSQPLTKLVDVWNHDPNVSAVNLYNGTTAGLQDLIQEAINTGDSIRGLGGGWSFSRVAATDGILVNTKPLNYRFSISQAQVHPQYPGDASNLVFAQCGMSIAELHKYFNARGKSLKTCGASNGQTIVGALSTGTHGSALEVGSIQDDIVGLHIVVSPGRHVWLERQSSPVLVDGFAQALGAELIRDDALFYAALVSFGSFGIIHGVLVEAEDIYYLHASRKRMPLDDGLWAAIDRLDFDNVMLERPPPERPYHFQVVIDPHDLAGGGYVTVMYKDAARDPNANPPASGGKITQGDNALEVIGVILDLVSDLTPFAVTQLTKLVYEEYDNVSGTLAEIFTDTTTRGKAASAAMGIPLGRVREALDMALQVNQEYPFPGLFAVRYVKSSPATLAFTRHPNHTCVFEIDGPKSQRTMTFYRRVWKSFDNASIPYTFHWGKMNNLNAQRVRARYGDATIEQWRTARHALLDTAGLRAAFANQFLRNLGLDG
jgi:FAD binding domain